VFISVYPFPVPGVWLGVAKMPIHFLTRIIMFISQCITGLNESTFKTPDTMKNASERHASQHRTWSWGMGLANWGRLGLADSTGPAHRSMSNTPTR
jgi:hypothetical protein